MREDAGDVVLLLRGASGADVDADGLGTDRELGLDTSPFKVDSDGLGDGSEFAAGTDPAFVDTDGDGLADHTDASPRSNVLYLFRDHLGSVVLVVREDRTIARRSLYSAYGKSDWNAATNPPLTNSPSYIGTFGFTGQRYEPSLDLYDYNARWYEPKLAKFLQADSIVPALYRPQSLNRYSYVTNDPVNKIDPTGHNTVTKCVTVEIEGSSSGGSTSCSSDTIPSYEGDSNYVGAEYSYGGGWNDRGPGSMLRYYRPIQRGGQSASQTQASSRTPQQLADQVWGSLEGAFAEQGVQVADSGWGGRMSGAQPFPGSATPHHDGRGGPDDLLNLGMDTVDRVRFIGVSQRLDAEIDQMRLIVRQQGLYQDGEAYVWKEFKFTIGAEHAVRRRSDRWSLSEV